MKVLAKDVDFYILNHDGLSTTASWTMVVTEHLPVGRFQLYRSEHTSR
jgi:hypothetical protein